LEGTIEEVESASEEDHVATEDERKIPQMLAGSQYRWRNPVLVI